MRSIWRTLLLTACLSLALTACALPQKPPPAGYESWDAYWQYMNGRGAAN